MNVTDGIRHRNSAPAIEPVIPQFDDRVGNEQGGNAAVRMTGLGRLAGCWNALAAGLEASGAINVLKAYREYTFWFAVGNLVGNPGKESPAVRPGEVIATAVFIGLMYSDKLVEVGRRAWAAAPGVLQAVTQGAQAATQGAPTERQMQRVLADFRLASVSALKERILTSPPTGSENTQPSVDSDLRQSELTARR